MKVAYCLNSLSDCGGIERVTIAKANALVSLYGCEVWLLVTDNSYEPILRLGTGVHLVDLEIDYYVNQSPNPIIDAWREAKKRRKHKHVLQQRLNEILPDVVISVGLAEKNFLPTLQIASHPVFVRELHYCKHYRTLFADTLLKKAIAQLAEWYDYGCGIRRYDKIVTLTETDKRESWNNNERVAVIPNPLIERPATMSDGSGQVVMAVGRLTAEKNFGSLLRAWQYVEAQHPDWKLQIWGEGGQRQLLTQLIQVLNLHNVKMMGYTPHVMDHYAEASILAVTSRFEGFGLMIIEAMSAGVPVVAYNCPMGPKELIADGVNGYLVTQDDETSLAAHIGHLIAHQQERQQMGQKAVETAADYDMNLVVRRWMSLFEDLLAQRGRKSR